MELADRSAALTQARDDASVAATRATDAEADAGALRSQLSARDNTKDATDDALAAVEAELRRRLSELEDAAAGRATEMAALAADKARLEAAPIHKPHFPAHLPAASSLNPPDLPILIP